MTVEAHRQYLFAIAYRMLGSIADAEDVVQETFVRWHAAPRDDIAELRAFLARIAARVCLDRLKSASHRREVYPGTWLPEPVVEPVDDINAYADELSVALFVTLERLSPLERAAFLLRDVFELDFAEIATLLERNEPAIRQLLVRARAHVRSGRPRFTPDAAAEARIAAAFMQAVVTGEPAQLASILAEDAVLYSDGGGKRAAALNPIFGAERIMRFLVGVTSKRAMPTASDVKPVRINGLLGVVISAADGPETIAIETNGERIVAIYIVRNPDKLRCITDPERYPRADRQPQALLERSNEERIEQRVVQRGQITQSRRAQEVASAPRRRRPHRYAGRLRALSSTCDHNLRSST
jgi:RNA polymerase sigma-70 factor (ECF subfamily)